MQLLGGSLILGSLLWLWPQVLTHYEAPPLWLALLAVALARVPPSLWAWWALGLLGVFWSLTPGNTLVLGLWELAYLAAFAAGRWLWGLVGLNLLLLGHGLLTTLTLAWAGLAMYFSGSSHYVAGAQALALVPLAAVWMFRSRWPLLGGLLLTAALYLALLSGARAVYLPLLLGALLLVWRLWREGVGLGRIGLGLGAVLAAVAAIDLALPFSPVQNALGLKATLSKQVSDISELGSIGSRLLMWKQTLNMALEAPLGTGNGSFREVLAAYQQYPGILFNSAHNYYLETAATGGWLRFGLLLYLLGVVLWRGWRTAAWPWALGAGGVWATLAFDVTGMYPAVMMLAFALLGAVHAQVAPPGRARWNLLGLGLGLGLIVWWYAPCAGNCAIERYLGYRPAVLRALEGLPPPERQHLLEQATLRNPKSLWVYRLRLDEAREASERRALLEKIVRTFPLASPLYYLELAQLLAGSGLKEEARRVLEVGLQHFPLDFRGYEPANFFGLLSPAYQRWREEAPRLRARLEGP
ncbi:O-antigen ligase domain-containing protein [Meiothermus sp. QL-1]|uniref:O-antigen ligase family protein n=1 Tax=Meiothermus sp. QL-1 TaxID=2058095 RepID=UPI000E0C16A9|nr:O-antigen ligase family protein [Meiothermus sp. QL-1]RDI96164.1 O-antigen ligase domain-containing protein [Meiothermus sp. QL-1]